MIESKLIEKLLDEQFERREDIISEFVLNEINEKWVRKRNGVDREEYLMSLSEQTQFISLLIMKLEDTKSREKIDREWTK